MLVQLAVLAIPASVLTAQGTPITAARLDHVAITVRDLDAATMSVTVIVEDIVRARQVVASGVGRRFPIGTVSGRGRSFLVPPGLARGMWIEFLEPEA